MVFISPVAGRLRRPTTPPEIHSDNRVHSHTHKLTGLHSHVHTCLVVFYSINKERGGIIMLSEFEGQLRPFCLCTGVYILGNHV